jgi:hypothetical protein
MKYRLLTLATMLATFATKLADSATTVAVRTAEAADDLSIAAEVKAYNHRNNLAKQAFAAVVAAEHAAYAAYRRAEIASTKAHAKLINEVESSSATHIRVSGSYKC